MGHYCSFLLPQTRPSSPWSGPCEVMMWMSQPEGDTLGVQGRQPPPVCQGQLGASRAPPLALAPPPGANQQARLCSSQNPLLPSTNQRAPQHQSPAGQAHRPNQSPEDIPTPQEQSLKPMRRAIRPHHELLCSHQHTFTQSGKTEMTLLFRMPSSRTFGAVQYGQPLATCGCGVLEVRRV